MIFSYHYVKASISRCRPALAVPDHVEVRQPDLVRPQVAALLPARRPALRFPAFLRTKNGAKQQNQNAQHQQYTYPFGE